MGQEEELLRIARKLEKMVARKNTVRPQSLGHGPRPQEARRVRAGSPGGACWPGAREARAGRQGPREARLAQDAAPLGGCCELPGWACARPRALGRIARAAETRLTHASLDQRGSGALGGLRRARESERKDRDLEKDFRSPGTQGKVQGVVATAGRGRRGNGAGGGGRWVAKSWVPEKGQRNLS